MKQSEEKLTRTTNNHVTVCICIITIKHADRVQSKNQFENDETIPACVVPYF